MSSIGCRRNFWSTCGHYRELITAGQSRAPSVQARTASGSPLMLPKRTPIIWLSSNADASGRITYKDQIPWEIIRIFESHGFIWGGKWYHYDTMHFEYRPELLIAGKAP
jgi:D-alanyl-D-alanine carboxypeptidase-like protein